MGVRVPEQAADLPELPLVRPFLGPALGLIVLIFAGLVANGRPIGAGDTRATERVAASLVRERDFDLDEYPEIEPPFARQLGDHRISIYPVLSAVMATPVFAVAAAFFDLDETGTALAGKLAAALFAGAAAGVLYLCLMVRASTTLRGPSRGGATLSAVVFPLGTSLCATSQALWQHPAAVLFLCLTLLALVLAEQDDVWAGRAGLPLGLMVAARHADALMALVIAIAVAARWPRRALRLLMWGLPAAVFVALYNWVYLGSPLRHGFSGSLSRFTEPWGVGHLGLLVSPGKGLLVFTPVILVALCGLVRAFRAGERWLAGSLGCAALADWLLKGRWQEWHGGECWGPRMLTDLLPLLFLFMPEGLRLLPRVGRVLAGLSIAVQALGALAYDYRWERLYQRPEAASRVSSHPELWDIARSPIVFYVRRRVVIFAVPRIKDGRIAIREHPVRLFGPTGSRVEFRGDDAQVLGGVPAFGDVHLERGAQVAGETLRLHGRFAAVFLRVLPEARARRLELRIAGSGRGPLYVAERSFWTEPRWTTYQTSGSFLLRHPYFYPQSGGGDLVVTVGRGGGEASLQWVSLVPPGEPLNPLRVP
jgi:hypothetical protein